MNVEKLKLAAKIIFLAIKEAGGMPSGHLYAAVMGSLSLQEYQTCLDVLKSTGLVKESNHFLTVSA